MKKLADFCCQLVQNLGFISLSIVVSFVFVSSARAVGGSSTQQGCISALERLRAIPEAELEGILINSRASDRVLITLTSHPEFRSVAETVIDKRIKSWLTPIEYEELRALPSSAGLSEGELAVRYLKSLQEVGQNIGQVQVYTVRKASNDFDDFVHPLDSQYLVTEKYYESPLETYDRWEYLFVNLRNIPNETVHPLKTMVGGWASRLQPVPWLSQTYAVYSRRNFDAANQRWTLDIYQPVKEAPDKVHRAFSIEDRFIIRPEMTTNQRNHGGFRYRMLPQAEQIWTWKGEFHGLDFRNTDPLQFPHRVDIWSIKNTGAGELASPEVESYTFTGLIREVKADPVSKQPKVLVQIEGNKFEYFDPQSREIIGTAQLRDNEPVEVIFHPEKEGRVFFVNHKTGHTEVHDFLGEGGLVRSFRIGITDPFRMEKAMVSLKHRRVLIPDVNKQQVKVFSIEADRLKPIKTITTLTPIEYLDVIETEDLFTLVTRSFGQKVFRIWDIADGQLLDVFPGSKLLAASAKNFPEEKIPEFIAFGHAPHDPMRVFLSTKDQLFVYDRNKDNALIEAVGPRGPSGLQGKLFFHPKNPHIIMQKHRFNTMRVWDLWNEARKRVEQPTE